MTSIEQGKALLQRNKRWAGLVGGLLFIFLIWPRKSNTELRGHVGSLIAEEDYSPYAHVNAFADFKKEPKCDFSSLELYRPTKKLCENRREVMDAMSDGGRIGFNAPYQTRDCDMRWYTTTEICTILSRFTAIHLVGDSMMRHLGQAINVFLREDLPTGARNTWKAGNPPGLDCTCHTLWNNHDCDKEGYVSYGTMGPFAYDSSSMRCPEVTTPLIDFLPSPKEPPMESEIQDLKKRASHGGKGEAFIFGQGGWNDFELAPAQRWIGAFEGAMAEVVTGYQKPPAPPAAKLPRDVAATSRSKFHGAPHRLWISPNAQGLNKNPAFVFGQNNIKLMGFERQMRAWLDMRGFDVLGMFNLTVQSDSFDGTHASMEANLVKAMMVFNWLDWAGRES